MPTRFRNSTGCSATPDSATVRCTRYRQHRAKSSFLRSNLAALGPEIFVAHPLVAEVAPLLGRVSAAVRRQVPAVGAFVREFAQQGHNRGAERAQPPQTSSAVRRESTNGVSATCDARAPRRMPVQ